MWRVEEHSDQENLRYSWLRSVEWITWPSFILQPIVPLLLYFFTWQSILISIPFIDYAWRLIVAPRFLPVRLLDNGPLFVLLKFVTCPAMAFLLWQQNYRWEAALALFWPLANLVIDWPLTVVEAVLAGIFPVFEKSVRTMDIGPVQNRLMSTLGYTRYGEEETVPDETHRPPLAKERVERSSVASGPPEESASDSKTRLAPESLEDELREWYKKHPFKQGGEAGDGMDKRNE
jgi:hypothetical protein